MIEQYKNIHQGQRCFILGSGPSLRDMNLAGLQNEITFSCNRGYLLFSRLGFPTTYWAIEDYLDAAQWGHEFSQLRGVTKFAAADISTDGSFIHVPFDRHEGFSTTPPFKFGGTVVHFMLQIAAYMGFDTAYLLGNDFKWDTSKVSQGSEWITGASDDNHFDPNYWPVGARSFPPQPERMRRSFFGARGHGLRIVNVTPGSALDVFETAGFNEVIGGTYQPLPSQQHPQEIEGLSVLLRELKPHHVIEIGVASGGSCATWHELNTGLVIGVDKQDKSFLRQRLPRFRAVTGRSNDVVDEVHKLLGHELADFLFIDGDHSHAGVTTDFRNYRDLVRNGGLVAFHDINAADGFFEVWEEGGVPRFWRDLHEEKRVISVGADWGGIGVVRI